MDSEQQMLAAKLYQDLTVGVQAECETGVWSSARYACYARASAIEDFARCRIRTEDELR